MLALISQPQTVDQKTVLQTQGQSLMNLRSAKEKRGFELLKAEVPYRVISMLSTKNKELFFHEC